MIADDRFWERVDNSGDCWEWTGFRDGSGYGKVHRFVDGRKRNLRAHRWVLMLQGVSIDGLDVDHMCHTKSCVRPEHLRAVTRKQNLENYGAQQRNNKSGVRGVFWDGTFHRWVGAVRHLGKRHAKTFASKEDAAAWVLAKRLELHTHNDADRAS